MSVSRAIVTFLLLTLAGITAAQAVADNGYQSVFSDWVTDGQTVHAGDCYLTFGISNGSNSIYLNITSPGGSARQVNIPKGNTYYYSDSLRIYVVDVGGIKALVDVSKPGGSTSSGTKVYCDTPGQTALGGDVVSFPVVIQNNDPSDHIYSLSSFSDVSWKTWFDYGGKGIYKINVPSQQSRTVNLMVQTWGNTPVGEKKVVAYVDDSRLEVFVDITSANQSADVSAKVSSKIASIGDKITYDIHIKNLKSSENVYKLAVTGLPDNWYYRFKEDAASTEEMAEVVIPSSSEKDLILEIVPPYSVTVGDYNFTAIVTTPENVAIKKGLTLTLKSGTGMSVTSSKLAYTAKPGENFDIVVYVANTGQGSALTNVYPDATAPQGWMIQVSPNRTNSIKAGDTQAFTITVQPPGNIVASDYEVKVNVKSDQAQKEMDYRITIQTESYVPFIGVGIIVLVVAGLFLVYRKYGRR